MLLKEFYKKEWWRYLLGILVLLVVDYIQVIIPQKIGQIFDILNTNSSMDYLKILISSILFLAFGLVLGRFLWRIFIFGSARLFQYKTIDKMFSRIITLDQNFFDKWRTGDLMTRFTSDTQMARRLTGNAVIMLVDTTFMTILTIYKMNQEVSWKLTLVSILPLPFIALVSLILGKLIHKKFIELQESTSDLSNITEESIAGMNVIKVFSNHKTIQKLFEKKAKRNYDAQISLIKVWGFMFPVIMFLGALATILVFRYGGEMVITKQITLGNFIATNQYVGMLVWPMMAFGWLVNIIQRGKTSVKRIEEVLEQKSSIEDPKYISKNFNGVIKIKNLTFKYPETERNVLKNISLDINSGEMVAFVGKIGSGKSTLSKLITKLYKVKNDSIFIDDVDINKLNSKFIRDNIAYVPQDTFLFSMPIKDNIMFSNTDSSKNYKKYTKIANVHEDINALDKGYDTQVGERGVSLSGGQRQRVTIARALAKDSKMIILDDCLSAVDTETEEKIIKNLREEIKNRTILVISHRLKAVKEADKIFVFEDGTIIEQGNHEELINLNGTYYSMYQKQLIEEKLKEE
ncbi:multidrug ABC transporter ATP-binding protein [Tepiditoga spiralis]|uniref:Multidrug ABC transporter ATP-binding protein n=1 Tax=Tepiditoga spiralis TaxID=2108365 RepID=A0A7G1G9H3_9BACT|nr:multidrug ABC transporter ATP-binding protein [Tepiditoga spiralis]